MLATHEYGIPQAPPDISDLCPVMYCIVFMVKRFLIEVDPEELEQMRYEWKGA